MKKVDLNKNLIGLDGKEIQGEGANIGKIIASTLSMEKSGDALKFWDWALELYKGRELKLDTSDFKILKDHISNSSNFSAMLKAQTLQLLDDSLGGGGIKRPKG